MFALLVLTSSGYERSPAEWFEVPHAPHVAPAALDTEPAHAQAYAWLSPTQRQNFHPLSERLSAPPGFTRVAAPRRSFAEWLRNLPVAAEGSPVKTARGQIVLAGDHPNLAAVIILQPRQPRLLDSAGMMIRLKAEHAWSADDLDHLGFHFTSGQTLRWQAWARGIRPLQDKTELRFIRTEPTGDRREQFCRYLETMFGHASTTSLLDDTRPAADGTVAAGDILLRPGPDGHTVMILDVATDSHGRVRVLLGQGGSPARTFHVLRSDGGSAWFPITRSQAITLAGEASFTMDDLRRWQR